MDYENILNLKRKDIVQEYQQIGKGSSRIVFSLGDAVVKCAIGGLNGKGVGQNTFEYNTYECLNSSVDILCPVLGISDDEQNLVMAKAIPLTKVKDIPDYLRKEATLFKRKLKVTEHLYYSKQNPYYEGKFYNENLPEKKAQEVYESSLFKDLLLLIHDYNLLAGDCFRTSSWGYYDGKFVLLDYGCSQDLHKKYYNKRAC